MFKPILAAAALAVTATSVAIPAPAMAQSRWYNDSGYNGYQQVQYRNDRRYRSDARYRYRDNRCRDEGKGGLAIGAIAGGLLGNTVAGGGDRTLGTILGAGVGALAGRAIDKSDGAPCRR